MKISNHHSQSCKTQIFKYSRIKVCFVERILRRNPASWCTSNSRPDILFCCIQKFSHQIFCSCLIMRFFTTVSYWSLNIDISSIFYFNFTMRNVTYFSNFGGLKLGFAIMTYFALMEKLQLIFQERWHPWFLSMFIYISWKKRYPILTYYSEIV